MSKPLMPLRANLNLAVVCLPWVLHDAPHSVRVGGELVAKFPEGVALEVEPDEEALAPRDSAEGFPFVP